jgi:biopolymer transport protein TolR
MNTTRRRQHRLMNQINVVPYIDVMLVLLVIFMVTAPLMNPGVVDLPSVGRAAQPNQVPLEITIRNNGDLALIDRERTGLERSVTLDDLVKAIKAAQGKKGERPVVIAAEKTVRYEQVMNVMDRLQQGEIKRVGLLVRPRN